MSLDGHGGAIVGTFSMPPGTVYAEHTHERHQLVWAAAGVVMTAVGPQQWVLPSSRALWVPAGVPHVTSASGGAVMRSVYVDPARTAIRWKRPTAVAATPLVAELVNRLGDDDLPRAQRRRTEAVLLDVLEPVAVARLGTPLPQDARARDVADALLDDPADGRSLEQFGAAVGASARTLARAFDRDTGMGFGRWRTDVRMQAALRLLADGVPVSRVAGRVGYASVSAFVAAFRGATGVTPGDYFSGPPRP
jgi:AraC-like DNA-binding protein